LMRVDKLRNRERQPKPQDSSRSRNPLKRSKIARKKKARGAWGGGVGWGLGF